ncbi:MAG: porphobilinogen synthase, partial [Desulfohalobium sp.]
MSDTSFFRGRRLRQTAALRDLVRETSLRTDDLIQPYFVAEGDPQAARPIGSMPGQHQLGLQALSERIRRAADKGLRAVMLFGIPAEKDPRGSQAYAPNGVVQEAVRRLKSDIPQITVITDVCLCEFTSHGHCGLVQGNTVLNDPTLELLAATAVSHAEAGADIVAPSDMMDGRVQAIRTALDQAGYHNLP